MTNNISWNENLKITTEEGNEKEQEEPWFSANVKLGGQKVQTLFAVKETEV